MTTNDTEAVYRAFGRLVRLHRQRLTPRLTQERLGERVGLSRTSITNIEKGRQHVLLHQVLALADVLQVSPEALLPEARKSAAAPAAASKLPQGTEEEVTRWVEKIVGE